MAEWVDELTLVKLTEPDKRVNSNGFAEQGEESRRTVFCNMKSVGYNEYFKSQQTGKVVERKCDVHKADYEGEDTVELGGKAYFVLKTYDIDDDTVELTLTDLRYECKRTGAAEHHYPTMSIDELCALPVETLAEKDCLLFLCT